MDELYLDNIDEYVIDHNKIVTYKWLSLTLGVHVNTAKQMLYHYLDHKRKESSAQLHATYLLSGKFVDNGQTSHKVSVVKEDQLEDMKSKMSLVVSVHVYSVQKASLKDSGPLYSVDYDAVKDNLKDCSRYSAIRCTSAVPMSSVELQQARDVSRAPAPEPEQKKTVLNGDTKPPAKPQKGIMGMFGNKAAPKAVDSSKDIKSEPKEEEVDPPKSKPAAKSNPMANFFGTQTKKPDKSLDVKEAAQPSSSSSTAEQQRPSAKKQEEEKQQAAAVEPPKAKESRSKTKRVVDSDSDDDKMGKKKRRRIKKPEPDSSDEDVIPESPPKMETKESSQSPKSQTKSPLTSHQGNSEGKTRRRRRVLKSRTFIDDEGCIVTEKGYESESYSEAEDDAAAQTTKQAPRDPFPAKPAAGSRSDEKKSQKKTSANASKGAKQASIMGFFQKK